LFYTGLPTDEWANHLAQPAVKPLYQRRANGEVVLDLAERVGALPDLYEFINLSMLEEPYKLDIDKKYTMEEIADRKLKSLFGEEHGVEWFRQNGGAIRWAKKVEEIYWKPFVHARVPIYFESFLHVGADIDRVAKEHGIPDFDTWAFQALPDWNPCSSHEEKRPEFDMWAFYFRVPFHTFTSTANNPWLDEISRIDPYAYYIVMNEATAAKKGIKDGDWVEVKSSLTDGKIKGIAKLMQGIQPESLAISGFGGHWAKGLPIASQPGKGANIEWLIPLDFENMDIPTFNQDICVKVKVTKVMD
jgi:anaerobic selenocysteine-containing dehydrogenase